MSAAGGSLMLSSVGSGTPKRVAAARTAALSCSRERSGWLCALAQAPMRRCQLRDAKYSSLSASGAFSTTPSMRTWRCAWSQWNTSAARAFSASLPALAGVVVGDERNAAQLDVELLAQDDARGRLARRGRGGEHHGIGIGLLAGGEGGGEPGAGQRHRLGGQGIGQQVVEEFHGRYVIRDAVALQSCFAADKS